MTPDELVKKNMDLHAEWMRYVFDHPEVLDQVPAGADLVILPTDDAALAQANEQTLRSLKAQGHPVVVVRMKSPTPPVPTIEVPR